MPLVRISLPEGKSEDEIRAISEGVHQAMVDTIGVPQEDHFQIITEHAPTRLLSHKSYLGVSRSDGVLIIQITLHSGRSDEKKQLLYRQIADNLNSTSGVRKEDIMVVLSENESGDWSFGNGEAQMLTQGIKPHWGA